MHQRAGEREQAAAGEGRGDARTTQLGQNLEREFAVVGQRARGQAERERRGRRETQQQQPGRGRQGGP
ncbi:hypothetical protein [Thiobacillus sp.]